MTPKELIEQENTNQYGNVQACNPIYNYLNQNCVVAYKSYPIGIIFLIKTARLYLTYVSLSNKLNFHGHNYGLTREDSLKFYSLKDVVVLDNENYQKYIEQSVVTEL